MGAPGLDPLLARLVGTFVGEGDGDFPTVEPFRYREQVVFTASGGPALAYSQRTSDPASGRPMHAENGFLRPATAGTVELLLAHSFGLTEVQEGALELDADGVLSLRLASTVIGVAGTAKPVDAVRRDLVLTGDVLRSELWMSYAGVESQHLVSELHRTG
ncbi:MAG: FABP family protein [Nitriliruptoraceae bacterium]